MRYGYSFGNVSTFYPQFVFKTSEIITYIIDFFSFYIKPNTVIVTVVQKIPS